jgi:hypothetical protein
MKNRQITGSRLGPTGEGKELVFHILVDVEGVDVGLEACAPEGIPKP